MVRLLGGFYLQSGFYISFTPKGQNKRKTRGVSPQEILMTKTMEEFLVGGVLNQWRKPFDPDDESTYPELFVPRREFVTIGSAVTSEDRYRIVGRWRKVLRKTDAHGLVNRV